MPANLSIVIPTWNGRELLARYLPAARTEMERWRGKTGGAAELVIADDGSSDGTAAWLPAAHPYARVERSESNRGFAQAANAGVAAARHEIALLLNNDVELSPGALDFLPAWFEDPEIFGVTLRAVSPEGEFATGGKLGRWRRGFWETWRNYDPADGAPRPRGGWPSFALVGGFCAVRRKAFLELGGFDPLFSPYYWEDLDLSYRARKRGWRLGYEPRATIRHELTATIGRHAAPWRRRVVIHRNRLLFHAKNLDEGNLRRHRRWRRALLLQLAMRGDWAYWAGFLEAKRRRREVEAFRAVETGQWRLRDEDLELAAPG